MEKATKVASFLDIATETPWGPSQLAVHLGEGVYDYCTSSHGGIHVPPAVRALWPKALREVPTFAGGDWYEEDCDWAIVAVAMPHLFKAGMQAAAIRTVKSWKPELAAAIDLS